MTITFELAPIYREIFAQQIHAIGQAQNVLSDLPEVEELCGLQSLLEVLEPLHAAAVLMLIMRDANSIQAYVAALEAVYRRFKDRAAMLEARYAPWAGSEPHR
jgi:hypothetical protein